MIRAISPTDQYPLIYIPLVFVLTLNALRDAIEENKRKKKDKEINQRPTHLLSKKEHSIETEQFQLRVGNVIKVTQNETFPADLVLLASSEHGRTVRLSQVVRTSRQRTSTGRATSNERKSLVG